MQTFLPPSHALPEGMRPVGLGNEGIHFLGSAPHTERMAMTPESWFPSSSGCANDSKVDLGPKSQRAGKDATLGKCMAQARGRLGGRLVSAEKQFG